MYVCVCHHQFVRLGLFLCTLIRYLGFMGILFLCLVGCFSMIISTPAVLSVLYACVLYFCICTCSAQLSMFHMESHSRNPLIIIIIIIISQVVLHSLAALSAANRQHTSITYTLSHGRRCF